MLGRGEPHRATGGLVTASFFQLIGAQPLLGRMLVAGEGAAMALVGLAVGGAAAVPLSHLLRGFLFGIEPADPPTIAVSGVLLVAVALVAAWVPARRATAVDPMSALRGD